MMVKFRFDSLVYIVQHFYVGAMCKVFGGIWNCYVPSECFCEILGIQSGKGNLIDYLEQHV